MNARRVKKIAGIPITELVAAFQENAKSFDAIWGEPDLVTKYPEKWVAAFDGKIQIVEDDLDTLLSKISKLDVPNDHVVIEYVETKPKALILNVTRAISNEIRTTIHSGIRLRT